MDEQITDAQALVEAFAQTAAWMTNLAADGGPNLFEFAHVKAAEEAAELAANPSDIEEWADVAICLVGSFLRQKWTLAQITAAVEAKNAKNAARTWRQMPNGAWKHVKDGEAPEEPEKQQTPDHECDSGHFDRSICPEPCGAMHSFCATCGNRQDPCPHDPSATAAHVNDPTASIFPGVALDPDARLAFGGCGCWTCIAKNREETGSLFMPFVVCPECGNKRCPRATHHDNVCTGSNETGQTGSRFEEVSA